MPTLTSGTGFLANETECPYCHGTGWELVTADGGHETCKKCRNGCYQKKVISDRLSFANIPESFKDMRLETFDRTVYKGVESRNIALNALKAINYWLDNFETMQGRGMGLYLYSETKGSGKTRMAASVANELMYKKNLQVKFATSLQILNEIKATWNKNGEKLTESKLMGFLSTTMVLVIDDFGVEKYKDWIDDKFYDIINNRYNSKKITIFTSNSRLDLLKYDDRIINRIKERTFQIPFPEESVRDIIAKDNLRELISGIKKQPIGKE